MSKVDRAERSFLMKELRESNLEEAVYLLLAFIIIFIVLVSIFMWCLD